MTVAPSHAPPRAPGLPWSGTHSPLAGDVGAFFTRAAPSTAGSRCSRDPRPTCFSRARGRQAPPRARVLRRSWQSSKPCAGSSKSPDNEEGRRLVDESALRLNPTDRRGVHPRPARALRPSPRRRTLMYATRDPGDALEVANQNRRADSTTQETSDERRSTAIPGSGPHSDADAWGSVRKPRPCRLDPVILRGQHRRGTVAPNFVPNWRADCLGLRRTTCARTFLDGLLPRGNLGLLPRPRRRSDMVTLHDVGPISPSISRPSHVAASAGRPARTRASGRRCSSRWCGSGTAPCRRRSATAGSPAPVSTGGS